QMITHFSSIAIQTSYFSFHTICNAYLMHVLLFCVNVNYQETETDQLVLQFSDYSGFAHGPQDDWLENTNGEWLVAKALVNCLLELSINLYSK
ncbi:hypothetical protein ACJX0J_038223, partial [Zea mays]